ncbi:hypothetical protein F5888DRAFT_1634132 [Russula emetica]|nr:hypothetical protein F5888DRAFT_1634132 [Russula emetica]
MTRYATGTLWTADIIVSRLSPLLALKACYPDKISLLRGNHESRQITQVYVFYGTPSCPSCTSFYHPTPHGEECQQTYGTVSIESICNVFDYLNLAATFALSTKFAFSLGHRKIPHEGAFCDLMWSDPDDVENWGSNSGSTAVPPIFSILGSSIQLASPSTQSQAIPSAPLKSRAGTMSRSSPSSGTITVLEWCSIVSHTHTIHLGAKRVRLWLSAAEILFAGIDDLSQLIPTNRPGLAVAQWMIKPRTDKLNRKYSKKCHWQLNPAYSMQLSFLSCCSDLDNPFGDSPGEISWSNPGNYAPLKCYVLGIIEQLVLNEMMAVTVRCAYNLATTQTAVKSEQHGSPNPLATGITLGATESLRLTSSEPNSFLFVRWALSTGPQLWKVLSNLDKTVTVRVQDPSKDSADIPTPVESSLVLLPATLFNTPKPSFLLLCTPLLCIGMDAASGYNRQVSPDDHLQPHGDHRQLSIATSLSPTPVNDAAHPTGTERPSLKLRIPGGASNILNSTVIDTAGQSLYSTLSDSKRTTLRLPPIQWDHHSPRMVFRQKKMKCKEWLKLAGPNDESRIFTHGDAQFTWMQGQGSASGHLIPADRPGLTIARWQVKSGTDDLILEIFQEAPIESGIVEVIVLSVVLLRSGHSLGDSQGEITSSPTDQTHYSHGFHF